MNLEQLLKNHGHEVAIFSQQYPLNEPSPWSKYWPTEFKMKPSIHMLDSLMRPFGLGSIQKHFKALLDDFQPEVVHLNNIHTQLSPILAELAHDRGIRVVWTIHDSKLVCPCYTCMRDGKWCEGCFTDKRSVLRHRCMTGGLLGSYIGYLEAKKWTADRLQNCVDAFICPSQFMADTLRKGGFHTKNIVVLHNFFEKSKKSQIETKRKDYYVFLGRLSQVKGVKTLCESAMKLPYKLVIIGDGPLEKRLRTLYNKNIEYTGELEWTEIQPILSKARFMVIPSEWSENNPLSVIESLSVGTPVIGSDIGGIPELITTENGRVFVPGNQKQLTKCIQDAWQSIYDYHQIAEDANLKFGEDHYYNQLFALYKDA